MINKIINMKFFIKKKNNLNQTYSLKDNYTKITNYFKFIHNNVIIVCIGTNRTHNIDSLGPFVGSILKEDKDFNIPVYGTLTDPIHAKNINEKISMITNKHPESIIIAIDACISQTEDVGKIIIKENALEAGKGIGNIQACVGDLCILGVMGDLKLDAVKYYVDMKFLSNMAFEISKGIMSVFKNN